MQLTGYIIYILVWDKMLSHTRMGVPYEYTRMGQHTHIGQNSYS